MAIEARMRELASAQSPDWATVKDALMEGAAKIDELNTALSDLAEILVCDPDPGAARDQEVSLTKSNLDSSTFFESRNLKLALEKALESDEGRELLVRASTLKPGTSEMRRLHGELLNRFGHLPEKTKAFISAENWKKGLLEIIGVGVFLSAIGLFIYGGLVLLRDSKNWLKTGDWDTTKTYDLWHHFTDHPPKSEWVGAAKIFDWILAFPLAGFLMIVSLVLVFLVFIIAAKVGPE